VTSDSLDRPPTGRRFLPVIATVVFVTIVCGIALSHQQPPAALPAEVPPDAFSAMRAMKHVAAIAREPHPLGTAAAEPVRTYLLAELKALGFEPEIQQPHDARPIGGPEPKSLPSRRDVRNIIARWRGTGPARKKALLLSAHYDSRTSGP
jgi:acetylornithine deacetylase/succinyl-diaminopimelate desuccinylase-like protein